MKNLPNSSRLLALLTAGVLSAGVMFHPAPARADKAKNYKYGAIALGAVGAYLLSKGKTVEGAAVLGAGAYTYKKGEDSRKSDGYNDYRDRYDNRNRDRNNNRYPNPTPNRNRSDNSNDYSDRYRVPSRNRLGDNNNSSGYRPYRNDDHYGNDRYRDNNRERNNRDNDRYNQDHPKIR